MQADPLPLSTLIEQVLTHLRQAGHRLVTVESCTGGMICGALTSLAGSSDVVEGGFITYSNEMKISAVGVPSHILDTFGAVSEETACCMVEGALENIHNASLAISVTGIAGPGGGTTDKPVGTVCFGFAERCKLPRSHKLVFPGDRSSVRDATVRHALQMLLSC
ncbi:CinA family protein [Gluconobacter morbifer]|uniref:CinA C-terminal domain-containing protein n=1 Tax=Gluconobacter morbifer G707 TaxID=1088869 RepID=G6XHV1_9PROT|nr:CinA family protein [Gluconobacter morbifer]EHH68325.1 hypothetical protein GMO_10950 [Gluconobacter morbifer G707]